MKAEVYPEETLNDNEEEVLYPETSEYYWNNNGVCCNATWHSIVTAKKSIAHVATAIYKGRWYYGLGVDMKGGTFEGRHTPCTLDGGGYATEKECLKAGFKELMLWFKHMNHPDVVNLIDMIKEDDSQPELF